MANFFEMSAEQHEAAAAALGIQAKALLAAIGADEAGDAGRHQRGMHDALELAVCSLAREAARHAHRAEYENERMAAVLAAQCSHGHGAPLTAEELAAADAAFCLGCSSIPCRCRKGE